MSYVASKMNFLINFTLEIDFNSDKITELKNKIYSFKLRTIYILCISNISTSKDLNYPLKMN